MFRDNDGNLVEININNFKNDKLYYLTLLHIFTVKSQITKS